MFTKTTFDYDEARRLRAEGAKISDIALKMGVSKSQAGHVCRDVECPNVFTRNGRKFARNKRVFDYAEAQRLFVEEGLPKTQIGRRMGVSAYSIGIACAGLVGRMPSQRAQLIQADKNRRAVVRMLEASTSRAVIAETLGLSRGRINDIVSQARRMGLLPETKPAPKLVEIPTWVPNWLHKDHQIVAELEGPEAAASWCRQRKAEAAASCR